jgi:hypothetical protein
VNGRWYNIKWVEMNIEEMVTDKDLTDLVELELKEVLEYYDDEITKATSIPKEMLRPNKYYIRNCRKDILVCCSTCHNDRCKKFKEVNVVNHHALSFQKECFSNTDLFLWWREDMGYLPKLHEKYSYINWKPNPIFTIRMNEFISKEEMEI